MLRNNDSHWFVSMLFILCRHLLQIYVSMVTVVCVCRLLQIFVNFCQVILFILSVSYLVIWLMIC